MNISILDLGLGNLHSVARAFERAGAAPQFIRTPREVDEARALVVPGQGAFRECAAALKGPLGPSLERFISSGRSYLGICLGMQLLFETSEEAPGEPGLGLFAGTVKRFAPAMDEASGDPLKVPHMGWNQIDGDHPLLEPKSWFYFVHSYHCVPRDTQWIAATADYGTRFCAAVARDNVFACQFHPEKSHHAGGQLIKRFLEQCSWS